MSRIEFNERSHRYTVDGEHVPSVTTVLDPTLRKQGIEKWRSRTVAEFVVNNWPMTDGEFSHDAAPLLDAIDRAAAKQGRRIGRGITGAADVATVLAGLPDMKSDEAKVRGTQVHELARRIIDGEDVAVPENLSGYVDADLDWIRDWQSHDELTERAVGNIAIGYAGTFDLIATLGDERRWLIDYKTSPKPYPENALQLVAYRNAEIMRSGDDDVEMPGVDCCGVVLLGEFGYRFYEVTCGVSEWTMFQRCLRNFRWLRENDTYPKSSPLFREMTAFDRAEFAS